MKKGSESAPRFEIDPGRSLRSYIGRKPWEEMTELEKGIKSDFNLKIRGLHKFDCPICQPGPDGYRIDPGEILLLINRQYGFLWNSIPWGKFEEISEWLTNNHHKRTLLLRKEYHYHMISGDTIGFELYRNWFNEHEKRVNGK